VQAIVGSIPESFFGKKRHPQSGCELEIHHHQTKRLGRSSHEDIQTIGASIDLSREQREWCGTPSIEISGLEIGVDA